MAAKLFLSYRREDSQEITGRIYDRLVAAYRAENIFKDVDNIPPGADFRAVLQNAIGRCKVVMVIIGPNWATAKDSHGYYRLFDPNDFVRIEVETALYRSGIVLVPVLVMGAKMPDPSQLPPSLQELAYRNAVQIRNDPDFHRDMSGVVYNLATYMGKPRNQKRKSGPPWAWIAGAGVMMLIGLLTIAVLLLGSAALRNRGVAPTATSGAVATEENAGMSLSQRYRGRDFAFDYVSGWVVEDATDLIGAPGAVFISDASLSSLISNSSRLPSNAVFGIVAVMDYQSVRANSANGTLPTAEQTLINVSSSGIVGDISVTWGPVSRVRIGGYNGASMRGSSFEGDWLMMVVELDRSYGVFVGMTAPNEMRNFEPIFTMMAASLED